jgi:hypothetical protein
MCHFLHKVTKTEFRGGCVWGLNEAAEGSCHVPESVLTVSVTIVMN